MSANPADWRDEKRRGREDYHSDSEDDRRRRDTHHIRPDVKSRHQREDVGRTHRHGRDRQEQERRDRDDGGSESRRKADFYRERSRSAERPSRRQRSRSPAAKRRRRRRSSESSSRSPPRRSRVALPSQDDSFRGEKPLLGPDGAPVVKQKPNYKPTGLLAKEANTVAGTTTVLKYHEPPEARKPSPKDQWRMYVFKRKDLLDTIYLHQKSVWLLGRDQNVIDYLLEHPSVSKQHAVVQFRNITTTDEFGDKLSRVKPYVIDLDSANGTKLNGRKIEGSRFVELVDGDVLGFGDSEREYVLMLPPPD